MQEQLSFGRSIREQRRALDLTQDELARRVGCAPVTVRKIEYDELRPSQQIAERLAMALAIPLDARADFVRRARQVRPGGRDPISPSITPAPARAEIGAEDLSGRAIRGYALAEKIGSGGFGVVYRATQPLVEREVAIKIVLPQYADHPDFIRRFEAEARLVARLEHPHIVPLYDYWREPGVAYLVMRLLRGGSVSERLRGGPLDPALVARIFEQIGAALAAAHRMGVVHRDLKPANVLLDEADNAYLVDFGIAKQLADPTQELTQQGMYVGSPAYSSPEQLRAEVVTPQTDIYALGLLLFELLTGARPFRGPTPVDYLQQQLSERTPLLAAFRPDLPTALDTVIQCATSKQVGERYPDVPTMLEAVSQALQPARPSRSGQQPALEPRPELVTERLDLEDSDNPYKGLQSFDEADASVFVGRESLVQQLLVRLAESSDLARFLAVVGPSGSGKSSVVRAALVPALRRGGLPGSESWYVTTMTPGASPIAELEAALLRVAPAAAMRASDGTTLRTLLQEDAGGLVRAAQRVLPPAADVELVLVIDQFEEVFTQTTDEASRAHLLALLLFAVLSEHSRVRLVITVRADFLDRPLQYADFGELLRQRVELVLPLTPDELERAIQEPAHRAGLVLEAGLVGAIMRDVADQPGILPLLQHALSELFTRRAGRTLNRAAYQAIGGVAGALGNQADSLYLGFDAVEREACRDLFLRLVVPGEGAEDTRRRIPLTALQLDEARQPALARVLEAYGRQRLLTFDRDPLAFAPTVEVAHEALIRAWPRLRQWLDASREALRVRERLSRAAAEWRQHGADPSYLATGARLTQFAGLLDGRDSSPGGEAPAALGDASVHLRLNTDEREFLGASLAAAQQSAENERSRQARELAQAQAAAVLQRTAASRLRYLVGTLATFLLLAIGLSAFAFQQRSDAETRRQEAIASAAEAQRQQQEAQSSFRRAEAQRLAGEANQLILEGGNSEVAALLALRSLNLEYTPQGDQAISAAARTDLPWRRIVAHHDTDIRSLVVLPDGRRALSSGGDGTAVLWDITTGQQLQVYKGHQDTVFDANISPDLTKVATSSADGTVRLWDAQSGKQLATLYAGALARNAVFSPDGRRVLTATQAGTVLQWDVATGEKVLSIMASEQPLISASYSPDGTMIVEGGRDTLARVFDAGTGTLLHTYQGNADWIWCARFAPDGRTLATCSDDRTVRVWDVATERELRRFQHATGVHDLEFSQDGTTIASIGFDRTTRLWDVATGQEVRHLTGVKDRTWAVAISPDSRYVLTSAKGAFLVWDLQDRGGARELRHPNTVNVVRASADGKILLSASLDRNIRIWDVQTGKVLRTLVPDDAVSFLNADLSPNGEYAAASYYDGNVFLWEVATGRLIARTNEEASPNITFSRDSTRLYIQRNSSIDVRDTATGKAISTFSDPAQLGPLAASPDGRWVALRGVQGYGLSLRDARTGALVKAYAETTDLRESFWDDALAFSPDSRTIAAGFGDGTVRLFSIEGGAGRVLRGHSDSVQGLAFSPDGKYLVSTSADRTARLWDLATGREIRRLTLSAGINSAAFSPDSTTVYVASDNDRVQRWDVDLQQTERALCGQLLRDLTAEERGLYGIADTTPTCPAATQ